MRRRARALKDHLNGDHGGQGQGLGFVDLPSAVTCNLSTEFAFCLEWWELS